MKKIEINSMEETSALANKIAELLGGSGCICLAGDLGAGKTTFTKALGKAIGIDEVITSPTFNILKIYEGETNLYHIDAYRLEAGAEELGFEEIFEEPGISVIEWYIFIEEQLPKERLEIQISLIGEKRIFKLFGIGKRYEKMEGEL